jgi:hypothetical protein
MKWPSPARSLASSRPAGDADSRRQCQLQAKLISMLQRVQCKVGSQGEHWHRREQEGSMQMPRGAAARRGGVAPWRHRCAGGTCRAGRQLDHSAQGPNRAPSLLSPSRRATPAQQPRGVAAHLEARNPRRSAMAAFQVRWLLSRLPQRAWQARPELARRFRHAVARPAFFKASIPALELLWRAASPLRLAPLAARCCRRSRSGGRLCCCSYPCPAGDPVARQPRVPARHTVRAWALHPLQPLA